MAEKTATKVDSSFLPYPGIFCYEVTVTDGDYFIAKDVTQAVFTLVAWGEDPSTGNPASADIDGTTKNKITINCSGASANKFKVLVVGK
jgi:hypothetical protein